MIEKSCYNCEHCDGCKPKFKIRYAGKLSIQQAWLMVFRKAEEKAKTCAWWKQLIEIPKSVIINPVKECSHQWHVYTQREDTTSGGEPCKADVTYKVCVMCNKREKIDQGAILW